MSQRIVESVKLDEPQVSTYAACPAGMTPAGVWVRVSSGGQDEANQVPDLERYCDQRNYWIATRYVLHARSAFKGHQQADLDQALEDMRTGRIQKLVIWHSDRLERRPGKALLDVLAEFTDAGGVVESVKEPALGGVDFGDQVTTFIAGLVNHEKSKHISDQVTLAHNRIRSNGALLGRIPFGYTSEGDKYNRRLVATDLAREVVPQIFDRCIAGESAAAIAAWLTAIGVPRANSTGHKQEGWSPKAVTNILRNTDYIGRRRDASGVMVHKCDAVIDAVTFRRAGEALDGRPKRGPVTGHSALLTGLLFCRNCNGPMYRIKTHGGLHYRCSADPKFGAARKSECRNMVPLAEMDTEVLKWLAASPQPVYDRVWVEGINHAAEIELVNIALIELPARNLPEEEEDTERANLRAERRRLQGLESTPGHWERKATGETYGRMFDRLARKPAALQAELKGRVRFHVFRDVSDVSVRLLDPDLASML